MAAPNDVYGSAPSSALPGGINMNANFIGPQVDGTPKAVALLLLFWGGVIWLLHYYGFRFNFGVSGGR